MTTITFTIPNELWLSSNQRMHWAAKARRASELRARGAHTGLASGVRFATPVRVIAHIGYATNGRADPANALAVKHLIDGMTDAGVWKDDDSKHLIGPDYRRDETKAPRGFHTVRLEIEEVSESV